MNNRITKTMRAKAGFTLVELIVVIAILGILAGVGTVGYSGYIKKANMAADQQMLSGVRTAIQLAALDNPGDMTEAVVFHTGNDAPTFSNPDGWLQQALERAFGNTDGLTLKYNWGKGAVIAKDTLNYFKNVNASDPISAVFNGSAKPSFANDVDDLFEVIRDTAIWVSGTTDVGSGASLVQGAAEITMNGPASEDFANAWAKSVWSSDILMGSGNGENYNENAGDLTEELLSNAIANAGVVKARNTALACYLRDKGFSEVYDLLADYTYGTSAVPKDTAAAIFAPDEADISFGTEVYARVADDREREFDAVLMDYFSIIRDENGVPVVDDNGNMTFGNDSQAYKDGLAYYAMMSTVKNVNDTTSDDVYWDEMAGAVNLYGAIANGQADLDELADVFNSASDGTVAVTVMGKNGVLAVNISPSAAMPS